MDEWNYSQVFRDGLLDTARGLILSGRYKMTVFKLSPFLVVTKLNMSLLCDTHGPPLFTVTISHSVWWETSWTLSALSSSPKPHSVYKVDLI